MLLSTNIEVVVFTIIIGGLCSLLVEMDVTSKDAIIIAVTLPYIFL